MHNSYNQFVFHNFLSAVHVSNESSRSKHVEQTKHCGIKIDYKNCASRWSFNTLQYDARRNTTSNQTKTFDLTFAFIAQVSCP